MVTLYQIETIPDKCPLEYAYSTKPGFFVGGPVLAAALAVAANYGSKQENEAGEAVRGISANAIEAFNFLTNINSKYDVTGEFFFRATCVANVALGVHVRTSAPYHASRGRKTAGRKA